MNADNAKGAPSLAPKKLSNVEDIYPLSPMQQGMLFHSILDPSSGMYLSQAVFSIESRVNVLAFRQAWEEVVRRHAILRTAFVWENLKEARQVVLKNVELPWREEDWSDCSEDVQKERKQKFLREERESGFDLKRPPLIRFGLIKRGEEGYYFAMSKHHILMDASCVDIVVQEVFTLYE